ncbi:MAG: radical SAM family heme chaperone HemW [Defluviitaleaceae bacterium]|nr:radical SAM family heme chaperone HemW [Defluviitaleaceae bacterium]
MAGVYIHIPFCASKCAYCDFLSFANTPEIDVLRVPYIRALINEISNCERLSGVQLESVFFGGGTPSILSAAELASILNAVARKADISTAEITLEANPSAYRQSETSNMYEKFSALKSSGFNRVSLGLQAAQDHLLAAIGRTHTNEDFLRTHDAAISASLTSINADIMFALPGQTLADLVSTLEQLTHLQIPHISAYSLTIEDSTPLGELYKFGQVRLPDENTEREMYHQTRQILTAAGYAQYEISNFAVNGHKCRHNTLYWTRQSYFGFGIGAHSMIDNTRWRNTRCIRAYIDANGSHKQIIREVEHLSIAAQIEEFIFLGLRLTAGVSAAEFQRQFGHSLYEYFGTQIHKHKQLGTLEQHSGGIRLTPNGVSVSNIVLVDFMADFMTN